MKPCKRCGACCVQATITIQSKDNIDMSRWFNLHRCNTVIEKGKVSAQIPLVCQALIFRKDRKTSCNIYSNRPQFCKDYICLYTKDE